MTETHVTETTSQPVFGCACIGDGEHPCAAHLDDNGKLEVDKAPSMFLALREGRLQRLCPSCIHPASDIVVARLYNPSMDLNPFLEWDSIRVGRLFALYGPPTKSPWPVEADFYTDVERHTREAEERIQKIKDDAMALMLRGMASAAIGAEGGPQTGPTGPDTVPVRLGKFRES